MLAWLERKTMAFVHTIDYENEEKDLNIILLLELKKLYDDGLINEEEYISKKEIYLKEV